MKAITSLKKPCFPSRTSASFTTQQTPNPIPFHHDSQSTSETHFISLIHSSESTTNLKAIHARVVRRLCGIAGTRIAAQLISASCQRGSVSYALSLFQSCDWNLFVFNALIRGLCENSCFETSIGHFKLMLSHGVRPDRLTLPFVLKSVTGFGGKQLGVVVHCGVFKTGLDCDSFVRVSLVDMYVKFGLFDSALQLFDESPERNKVESVLLWNVAINGCCKGGKVRKAVELFEAMPERNTGSWNCLIDGLMRSEEPDKALELFDGMKEKNVVSWTTVIHGLVQNGLHEKALRLFFKMVDEGGVKPNELTFVSALSACAKMGALESGIKIHHNILRNRFKMNAAVGNALLDMYAKSGDIESAFRAFKGIKAKDTRTWGAMLWGWAIHGCVDKAIQCFEAMNSSGTLPDEGALLAVLTACSHAGRVNQGLDLFNNMTANHSVVPTMKHYAAVVDLYGRAGQLDEALRFIESMPLDADHIVWGALFCACRAHKNTELANLCAGKIMELDPKHPGSYVFLSNAYAAVGRWEDVERVRTAMRSRDVGKDPGWSSIEVEGKVHTFKVGDRAHSLAHEIYSKLEDLTADARLLQGYVPETEWGPS